MTEGSESGPATAALAALCERLDPDGGWGEEAGPLSWKHVDAATNQAAQTARSVNKKAHRQLTRGGSFNAALGGAGSGVGAASGDDGDGEGWSKEQAEQARREPFRRAQLRVALAPHALAPHATLTHATSAAGDYGRGPARRRCAGSAGAGRGAGEGAAIRVRGTGGHSQGHQRLEGCGWRR